MWKLYMTRVNPATSHRTETSNTYKRTHDQSPVQHHIRNEHGSLKHLRRNRVMNHRHPPTTTSLWYDRMDRSVAICTLTAPWLAALRQTCARNLRNASDNVFLLVHDIGSTVSGVNCQCKTSGALYMTNGTLRAVWNLIRTNGISAIGKNTN